MDNLSNQFGKAEDKLAKLAERHGEGYSFSQGELNNPEMGRYHHLLVSPEGKWAGEISHDDEGEVGNLYVMKEHRAALPKLLTHAITFSKELGITPPNRGSAMTEQAFKMTKKLLPESKTIVTPNVKGYGD